MRKKNFLILICVMSLCLLVSVGVLADRYIDSDILKFFDAAKEVNDGENTVVAVVNGKKIYQETIDFLVSGKEITLKNSTSAVSNGDISSYKNEILQEQIRNAVVLSEAERLGLIADYDEALKYTRENYELVKKIGGETYKIITDYMEEMGLTEEEYLKKSADVNRNMLTRGNLYDNFIKGKTGTNEELIAEYEQYVKELIENADIKYND